MTAPVRPVRLPDPMPARLWRLASSRSGVLITARVVEQGALGATSLVLARWLGVDDYAPVAALIVFNSLAVVASDLGLGVMIMSSAERAAGHDQVRRIRAVNATLAAAVAAASLAFDGALAAALPWAGAIWLASGEAFIRKSALLRLGRERRVAASEIVASLVLVAVAAGVAVAPARAVALVGAALLAKHVVEVLAAGGWRAGLGEHGAQRAGAVWWTQLAAYATANVDFVVIGIVVTSAAFSVYSLGFRVASLVTSQVAYAFGRLVLVDLARAEDREARQRVYDARVRLLFVVGVPAALVALGAAALVPVALGRQWEDSAWVIVLLAVATPWRMALGVTGALMVSGGHAATLVRWELVRLVATAAVLFAAAQGGLWTFTGAVAAVMIVATVVLNRASTRVSGLVEWRVPLVLAVPALAGTAAVVLVLAS